MSRYSITAAAHRDGSAFGVGMSLTIFSMLLCLLTQDWVWFFIQAVFVGPVFIMMSHGTKKRLREIEEIQDELVLRSMIIHEALDVDNNPEHQQAIADYINLQAEALQDDNSNR